MCRPSAFGTIFLLSPADCSGKRAHYLLNPHATFPLARRLHGSDQVTLGEAFSFMSQLYFRGKLAYARAFADPPRGVRGIHVIAPGVGLMEPDAPIRPGALQQMAIVPIDPREPRYRDSLESSAGELASSLYGQTDVVFLGSIATSKYLDVLRDPFGDRLRVPRELIGKGTLSRGSILLRSAESGRPLSHVTMAKASGEMWRGIH